MSERTVLLADDHPVFRRGLVEVIRGAGFSVVGDVGDGNAALAALGRFRPLLAVLDVEMPGQDGVAVAAAARAQGLPTLITLLTMHDEPEFVRRALDAGAKGYVLKDSAVQDIVACLNLVAEGRTYVSPTIAGQAVMSRAAAADQDRLSLLSAAELRVLKMIAQDRTTEQVAAELGLSPKTVEHHRSHIIAKLELKGPHALVRFAAEHRTRLR